MLNTVSTRTLVSVILAASIATLGGAYIFEYGFGYMPCHLCLQERVPYMIAIVATLGTLILGTDKKPNSLAPLALMAICALVLAFDAGLSAYHAGVEYKWWPGPETCTSASLVVSSLDALTTELTTGKHIPRCDSAAWTLLGISLAGYNMFIAAALSFLSGLCVIRQRNLTKASA
ncbi:MAG: disulfide bond formation protein B [Parvibaculaceae bacterium]